MKLKLKTKTVETSSLAPLKTVTKLLEFFAPQLVWLRKRAKEDSVKQGQFVSVNELIRTMVQKEMENDLRPEYHLSKFKGGVCGKYVKQGTNRILLSPDVARYFPDERSVNAALRSLVDIAKAELSHIH